LITTPPRRRIPGGSGRSRWRLNNDTTPRYDRAAAALAWQRTIEFLNKNLRASG
jgi:dienelactone hydrolase